MARQKRIVHCVATYRKMIRKEELRIKISCHQSWNNFSHFFLLFIWLVTLLIFSSLWQKNRWVTRTLNNAPPVTLDKISISFSYTTILCYSTFLLPYTIILCYTTSFSSSEWFEAQESSRHWRCGKWENATVGHRDMTCRLQMIFRWTSERKTVICNRKLN